MLCQILCIPKYASAMYSVFNYDEEQRPVSKVRANANYAQQERERRMKSVELTNMMMSMIKDELTPLCASEFMSDLFRQRGIPCMDKFTYEIIGKFRSGFGYNPHVQGLDRKFMVLSRWDSDNMSATMWTIEPVLASMIVRGNSIDCRHAYDTYYGELYDHLIDPMSSNQDKTTPKIDNEMRGRWAGWLLWRASLDDGGFIDSSCTNCNLSSTRIMFSIQIKNASLLHFTIAPKTIDLIATHAKRMCTDLGVSVSMKTNESTKLIIQPPTWTARSSNLRIFGNGSVQICGSPSDVELLTKSMFVILKKSLNSDPEAFMTSLRQLRKNVF